MDDGSDRGEPPREVELKLEIDPRDLPRLRRTPIVKQGVARGTVKISTVYYDTPDHDLRRAGLTLRVRKHGRRRIQTIKDGAGGAGLFARSEWEAEIDGNAPDLAAAGQTSLGPLIAKRRVRESLRPLFTVTSQRTTIDVSGDGVAAEMTIDRGSVATDGSREALCEVELEWRAGDARQLFAIARTMAEAAPVRLGIRTKADRGFALAEGAHPRVVKGGSAGVLPGMTCAEAFQAIGRACLRHFLLNEPVLRARRDAGAVHQMRVALRRLRAAISLFKAVVEDERRAGVSSELKWMANSLGPARDLDVFIARTIDPLRAAHAHDAEFAAVVERFEAERAAAYEEILALLGTARYRLLAIDVAAWLEAGPWLGLPDAALREEPIEEFARRELSRRTKKIRKRGQTLAEMTAEEQHAVRIAVKKLRYASEFFAELFPGRKARKRQKEFRDALEELQERLGDLNDAATGAGMTGGAASSPAAASLIAERHAANAEEALGPALAAFARFSEAKPFWKARRKARASPALQA